MADENKPFVNPASINEPGPDAVQPFAVVNETPADTKETRKISAREADPDELEDEIDQAEEDGDITPSKHGKPKRK